MTPKFFNKILSPFLVIAAFSGCAVKAVAENRSIDRDPRYPAHWWKEVPRAGAPTWEILPQDAGLGEVILSKRNELGIFSNFAPTPFTFKGVKYASLEGFWQMMLYPENADDPRAKFPGLEWKFTRAQVAQMTAFEAKDAGKLAKENMKKMNIDWCSFEGERFTYKTRQIGKHFQLIRDAMKAKLEQNKEVSDLLLKTGDLILRPDHTQDSQDPPEWRYYDIWMEYRKELQK